ncbi:GTP-binding protein 2-like [Mizuhopecten yessoensis]|uniref:GTP-binding protein 2 n=1 Tax=Mizuhopecten yessoensis TaxID=6573 RepID=A0A210Q480_MIZYE|nr:GTP-binding protein 2-like [Mizuhopecten yessoensis]OWF43546.1 GTP-binding protein 2 [Mizuhopecten yessoensis]
MDDLVDLFGTSSTELPASLPPEVEEGNIEYKLKLVNPSDFRLEHLVTQMKWRLEEGHGEAIYEIGVEDNGMLVGLTDVELEASVRTLNKMAERLGATTSVLRERQVDSDEGAGCRKRALEILVRKVPDDQQFIDLRLAVLGNVDAGKSTLLGVLTQGELDNGRGRARLNLFQHLHEIQSGRTSSISHEILGFNSKGEIVNYSGSRTVEEICENSSKLITLIDLAGHHKYLKTTIFGLTGHAPDFAMLVVSANTGMAGTTKEHLGLALALNVPIFVVVSKIDMCRKYLMERTVSQLEKILKSPGCKRVPMRIKTEDDSITAATNFDTDRITPIFTISSVTGKSLDLLTTFLNVLPSVKNVKEREKLTQDLTEFQIDTLFSVPGVGSVVGGTIHRGSIKEGDCLQLGPVEGGEFRKAVVKTVHRNRMPCRFIQAGQTATVALANVEREQLRKGMVLVSPEMIISACEEFDADIYLLYHSKQITTGFEATIHVGSVCQTCKIIEIEGKESIKTNEKARVKFRLLKQLEYMRVGSRLLFRQGTTKGMGEIVKTIPWRNEEAMR